VANHAKTLILIKNNKNNVQLYLGKICYDRLFKLYGYQPEDEDFDASGIDLDILFIKY
jgi:hypothetical protein